MHDCLTSLKDLAFGGRKGDHGFEQWKVWTALQEHGSADLPEGVQLPEVGAAWHGLVHDLLKLAAVVTRNTRRIRLYFASNWPSASTFAQAMRALGGT